MHYRILEINLKQVSFVSLSSLDSSSSPLAALNRGHTHLMSALKNAKPFVNKQIVTFQQVWYTVPLYQPVYVSPYTLAQRRGLQ